VEELGKGVAGDKNNITKKVKRMWAREKRRKNEGND